MSGFGYSDLSYDPFEKLVIFPPDPYSRNSTESTVDHKHNNHKHHHHGGAVCPSYGVGSMDTPDRTRVTSCKGVGRGGGVSVLIKSINF